MTEKVLMALFAKTTTPMLLAGDDRRYREVNAAACGLLGRSADELRSLRVDDLAAPEVRDAVPAMWEQFLEGGTQQGDIEVLHADGTAVRVSYSATAHIVPGLHLTVLSSPGREDPVLDRGEPEDVITGESAPLTEREREVLSLLALGSNGPEIASRLYLSPETVRTHTRRARVKLGARTRSHAIALAIKTGQIEV